MEKKKLGEIFNLRNGYTPSRRNNKFWENGTIPWFRMDDIRQNGHILTDSIQHITPEAVKGDLFKAGSIIMGTTATIGVHALVLNDFLCNQQFTNFEIKEEFKDSLDPKYLYYKFYLIDEWCLNHVNKSSFASVDISRLKKYEISFPSIDKQKEIIAILDQFECLIKHLEMELELRQKQFEYYLNSCHEYLTNNFPVHPLKSLIIDNYKGYGIKRDELTKSGKACIRYGDIHTLYNYFTQVVFNHVEEDKLSRKVYAQNGDILFVITSEDLEGIGKCITYTGENPVLVGGDIIGLKTTQNPKFLSYILSSNESKKQKKRGKVKSKVVHTNLNSLLKIKLPIPTLEIQDKIVKIFDYFIDYISLLEQEIGLRKKQFEYYRNALLK